MHTPTSSSYEENQEVSESGEITELAVVAEGEDRTTWFAGEAYRLGSISHDPSRRP